MQFTEEFYRSSTVYCSEEEAWEVRREVDRYEATRNVCKTYKKKMQIFRIIFAAVNFVLLAPDIAYVTQNAKLIVIPLYLIIASVLILCRKSLTEAAVLSLMLIFAAWEKEAFSIMPLWILLAFNAYMAYSHEKLSRYIKAQHGYPDFPPLTMQITREEPSFPDAPASPPEIPELDTNTDL